MSLINNELYKSDVKRIADLDYNWDKLRNKSFMISGATGMIGRFLIDVIMEKNNADKLNCHVYALGRDKAKAASRFEGYMGSQNFTFVECNINDKIEAEFGEMDFILHAASNTHPVAYSTDPVGTVVTNIIGTNNLLKYAVNHESERFVFASSVEVYGENRGDTEYFAEDYCGYIDCNTLRAGYPESKRAGEALCQAYAKAHGLSVVLPRLSRTFGPTMLMSDSKAISQFIKKGIAKEDIVLKSEGTQLYSYTYVADAVSGLLYCLFEGADGEAYNISDTSCDCLMKDLAQTIADYVGKQVVFEIPDKTEAAGYSKATKAILDSTKLKSLGWKAVFDMKEGIEHTIEILS